MTQQTPDDRVETNRLADAGADLSPPAAPLPMPRQKLESPRPGRDWLIFRAAAPRRG